MSGERDRPSIEHELDRRATPHEGRNREPSLTEWRLSVDITSKFSVDRSAGETINKEDLVAIRLPSSRFSRDAIRSAELAVGAKLRRNVNAQTPLREAWLSIPPLVRRGATVELVFNRGAISLTAQGEALTDGRRGAMIRVRNLKSKKIVTGRVIGINRVEVGR